MSYYQYSTDSISIEWKSRCWYLYLVLFVWSDLSISAPKFKITFKWQVTFFESTFSSHSSIFTPSTWTLQHHIRVTHFSVLLIVLMISYSVFIKSLKPALNIHVCLYALSRQFNSRILSLVPHSFSHFHIFTHCPSLWSLPTHSLSLPL